MPEVILHRVGPGVTVQDQGRQGYLAQGLSRGGAADLLAMAEGAALLGQDPSLAAIEIAGSFLTLEVTAPTRIAVTGARMRARCDGSELTWNASHALPAGAMLELGAPVGGYSYLHFGGGVSSEAALGARSAHLAAGILRMLEAGTRLALGEDSGNRTGLTFTPEARFDGGALRLVKTPQSHLFSDCQLQRFTSTIFHKDARGNRMGQRLVCDEADFKLEAGLRILSETIVPGDIQITGDGAPFVLLAECQTTGGYPRIGTVLPCDLPRLVQAPATVALRFEFVTLEEAVALERDAASRRADLPKQLRPLIRDPHDIQDLLAYQLIGGVSCGDELERTTR